MTKTGHGERSLGQRARARYFSDAKPAFLELFDPAGLRILDLGCGAGANGRLLKQAGARAVIGVERDADACAAARASLDEVIHTDLAAFDPAVLGHEAFDAVLASDVLEHLVDPEAVLTRVVGHLPPGGLVVASIPNVAHVWVFANLLMKRWPRKDSGIFDRTHLRFFARRDMVRLFEDAGLEVERVKPYFTRYRLLRYASLALSLYVFRDYWARQFLLVGRKPAAGGPAVGGLAVGGSAVGGSAVGGSAVGGSAAGGSPTHDGLRGATGAGPE
jgi:2-polyprenyl-3-methyl-5-hydroxy-6-metoxy-1,4-benzoquinol methylase